VKHTALDATIDALAVARLTHLIQQDEVWPLPELRSVYRRAVGDSRLVDLVDCPWCLSPHLAVAVLVARARAPRVWGWVAKAAAASYVTGKLESL
jgi:hypothetical protein